MTIRRYYGIDGWKDLLLEDTLPFDHKSFNEGTNNVILTDGDNYSVFLYEKPGIYSGHVFFRSRGKEAIRVGKEMLGHFFSNYFVETILGLTPSDKRHVLFFNKKLGFKEYGEIETPVGLCELLILTKQEFKYGFAD